MKNITIKQNTADSNVKAFVTVQGPLLTAKFTLQYSEKTGKHYLNNPYIQNEAFKTEFNKSGRMDQAWFTEKTELEKVRQYVMAELGLEDKEAGEEGAL